MANDSTSGPELDSSAAAIDSPSSASSGSFCTELCAAVKSGLRANRLPGTISFVVGATILVSYYGGGETTRPAFDALATLRDEGGMLFAAIATSVAAGVLPSIIQLAMRQVPDPVVPTIVFNCVFWFVMGPVVSGLYELQVVLFGDGTDVATVVKKVLFDQFVWNPCFWPLMSLIFRWRDHQFSFKQWRKIVNLRSWFLGYCSILVTIWGTWVPGTCVVYTFPSVLQLPAFNVILFMFSFMLMVVSKQTSASEPLNKGGADDVGSSAQALSEDVESSAQAAAPANTEDTLKPGSTIVDI